MKLRLFEFEDMEWLPKNIRDGMTDYLRFILNSGNFYEPVSPLIVQLLQHTGSKQGIDLCSGGGGTVEQIQKNIQKKYQQQVPFILTDKFPNINAYNFIQKKTDGKITYFSMPVHAAKVHPSLKGVRTIFSAFHHFDKQAAAQVIDNAVSAREGIGIFDGGDKNIFFILAIIILHPVAFFLFTPFLRPFKWSRLFFTYVIPVIPLCTIWDGVISVIRLYTPQQLLGIAANVNNIDYRWQAGKQKNKFGMNITYLLGYPVVNTEIG
ncbi:MAG: class I SAM-dependent methyltransferase [Ferruginibacter sp.]|nr:class I SAM-dependent methyltransferase [Ferruginibacter sp.]